MVDAFSGRRASREAPTTKGVEMPKKYFRCPDGYSIAKEDCISKCRMDTPCMSLPSRVVIAQDRPFKAVVSPSQAGKGLRQIYLEGTVNYCIDPRTKMFMLYGTKHHAVKEEAGGMLNAFLEEPLEDELGGGTSDYMDTTLLDYKLCGAYAVHKRAKWEERPTGEKYQKAGKRKGLDGVEVSYVKGDPKMYKHMVGWDIGPDDEWALQLNRYRMMWENKGFRVNNILIEATLRDGGVRASQSYGLDLQVYMIPIPILDDHYVMDYYRQRQEALQDYVGREEVPPRCSYDERWGGRKCDGYCDVVEACKRAGGWD